jgi:putative membrane protein
VRPWVQEAFECPVTFDVYAHLVVGSVLAFMIVYRFKFAYDRYYEAGPQHSSTA